MAGSVSQKQAAGQQQAADAQAAQQQQAAEQAAAQAAAQQAQYAPPPVAAAPEGDVIAQLTKLGELKAAGILTEAEFTIAKAKLLG